jgi:hypothetical protein
VLGLFVRISSFLSICWNYDYMMPAGCADETVSDWDVCEWEEYADRG